MDGSSRKSELKRTNSSPASPSGNKTPNSPPSQLSPAQSKKEKKKETKQDTPQSGKREGVNTDGQGRNDDEASPRSHNERDKFPPFCHPGHVKLHKDYLVHYVNED